jgi:ZIP family zinc transporter
MVAQGILLPFLGTSLGAACVFFAKHGAGGRLTRALNGFAAGVMVAASVWSLLIPAMETASGMGRWAFLPAVVGFWVGVAFLMALDRLFPVPKEGGGTAMMVFAVVLHNIPEGMAVGVAFAGYLAGEPGITALGAMAMSLGIALQNIPEGAIISLPLRGEGMGRGRAFWCGVLSGAVEPVGAVLTLWAAGLVVPILPYLLSFAAGAMMYVVVEELIPELSDGAGDRLGVVALALGFTLMMAMDVGLG